MATIAAHKTEFVVGGRREGIVEGWKGTWRGVDGIWVRWILNGGDGGGRLGLGDCGGWRRVHGECGLVWWMRLRGERDEK